MLQFAFPVSSFHLFLSGKLSVIYWTFMSGTWFDSGVWRSSSRAFGRHWILLALSFSVPITWCVLSISSIFFFFFSDICLHLLSRAHSIRSAAWCASREGRTDWFPYRHKHMVMFLPGASNIQCHRLDSWCNLRGVSIIRNEIKAGPWVLSDAESTEVCLVLSWTWGPLQERDSSVDWGG